MKITAPIGISKKPYIATKSSSFITSAGKQAARVVTNPVMSVTFHVFQVGTNDCKARPARYIVGLAVVHPAMITHTAPAIPAAL